VVAAGAALRFLAGFLGEAPPPLVAREPLPMPPPLAADLWRPPGGRPGAPLVLVHGLAPEGKDDPRLGRAAALLARGGFAVAVPDLPAMRAERLRPGDARAVTAALEVLARHPAARPEPATLVAVSVGLAPAMLAARAPAPPVRLLLALGGHAEGRELVRYFTTGVTGFGPVAVRAPVRPELGPAFLARNLDLVEDPADRAAVEAALAGRPLAADPRPAARAVVAVLENRDPARVDALLARLPPATQELLDAVSPVRYLPRLRARLLLVHGRQDPAVPYTESLRLHAGSRPGGSRLVLVDVIGHVEGQPLTPGAARDLLGLWSVAYELFRG
jgi:pimeloyl-ACP methyl ester carboxylesterase